MTAIDISGAHIVSVARAWIGTPYRHQGALKGVGVDCLGLVRSVWSEVYGAAHEKPPPYSRDWAEGKKQETMAIAGRRYMLELNVVDKKLRGDGSVQLIAGDVALFRMWAKGAAKHAGFVAVAVDGTKTLIHAHQGRGKVEEDRYTNAWAYRLAYAFRFPDPSLYGDSLTAGKIPQLVGGPKMVGS